MLKILTPLGIILFILVSCSSSKDYVVESDYSYQGNFKKYSSFKFISDVSAEQKDTELDMKIKGLIKKRMNSQGYTVTDNKPDLLVNYKLYFENMEYKGVSQVDLEYWLVNARFDDQGNRIDYPNEDEGYRHQDIRLAEGTMLITLIDRKKRATVWNGYTSGMLQHGDNLDRYLKVAVNKIFDEYRLLARGYEVVN